MYTGTALLMQLRGATILMQKTKSLPRAQSLTLDVPRNGYLDRLAADPQVQTPWCRKKHETQAFWWTPPAQASGDGHYWPLVLFQTEQKQNLELPSFFLPTHIQPLTLIFPASMVTRSDLFKDASTIKCPDVANDTRMKLSDGRAGFVASVPTMMLLGSFVGGA